MAGGGVLLLFIASSLALSVGVLSTAMGMNKITGGDGIMDVFLGAMAFLTGSLMTVVGMAAMIALF